jgi:DNA modification methylase
MVIKVLKKMEVNKGFIQIPAESKVELIGNASLPCLTTINNNPARLDKYGRLWSIYLKNRFPIEAKVEISKTENGYQIAPIEIIQEKDISEKHEDAISVIADFESEADVWYKVLEGDCLNYLSDGSITDVDLTFFDPPYRQGKDYKFFDDNQPASKYWGWIQEIIGKVYDATANGGAIYFMQREKNTEQVLRVLRKTGWKFQNLIIWKKKTSAVPGTFRFSKQYQIIVYATKGDKPRVFNRLRIDLPNLPEYKYERENGVYVTDVWDDIRELTSGYFAGDEAIRDHEGNRTHTQQSPVALLLRVILSSTLPGDTVLDPLAGTGPALVVAHQLKRNSIGIEIDSRYVEIIKSRLHSLRPADNIAKYYDYYKYTPNLGEIWPTKKVTPEQKRLL